MIPVLTAEDVRRQDAEAEARGISVETLMENAGWAVARAARRMMGGTYGRRVVVVCGKGNNGGDGLAAARMLHNQGAHVTAVLVSRDLHGLPAQQLERFHGKVVSLDALERELARADLVVDAIFGVGLARAPEGDYARAIEAILGCKRRILAVDVPSGVDSDTGRIYHRAVVARATVAFGGWKPGLLFEPGRTAAGTVEVADIGTEWRATVWAPAAWWIKELWPKRPPWAHKRSAGTVLVVAGSRAMPGAAALVTGASVHAGSGLTVLCAPEDVCRVVLSRVPEATTIPVPESPEGTIDIKALDLIRPRLDEFHAIALGPGLTTHPATVEFVRELVAAARVPIVVDADGLNALVGATRVLPRRALNTTILTPHAGELARLTETSATELEADRLAAARRVARAWGAVVVFKGPGTVTCGVLPDRQDDMTFINPTGGSILAQGGTGDVLTGLIASTTAQELAPLTRALEDRAESAEHVAKLVAGVVPSRVAAAVWMHGYAADRIAARLAPQPANASALIEELGPAIHEVCGS